MGLAESYRNHFIVHPTKPCTCDVGGVLDPQTFQFVTCQACRGLSYIRMSLAEIRDAYRTIQQRMCTVRKITDTEFNREARAIIGSGNDEPGYWLDAARTIEKRYEEARALRRQETRNRW